MVLYVKIRGQIMRVITGSARGKRLKTLEGLDVRPTSEKVKEAIFSIIQFDLPNARVLDLFAGSGQLGVEALSRGAKSCIFVDQSRASIGVVRENVEGCGFSDISRIVNMGALDFLRGCPEVDIALLDPPYSKGLILDALPLLESKIAANGWVICEHEGGLTLPEQVGKLKKKREYSYGKTVALTTYTVEE